jgi:SAM-dependent methyltransferase
MRQSVKRLPGIFIRYMFRRSNPIELGRLDRTDPLSEFGFERGKPIDRFYIEAFMLQNMNDIQGRVLEISDDRYTKAFGGAKVKQSDILHAGEDNPKATIISDLSKADNIPSDSFNCIIFTQTLQYIYDLRSTIGNLHRILKPGGVLLATFPGISQISRYDNEIWGDYWRFTTRSAQRLFEEEFLPENIEVKSHGNVLVATSFLYGLSTEDLNVKQLNYNDPYIQMVITARAVKV